MLEFVREGDTVFVTKLDRLARNTRHLLEISEYLQEKGVALNILNIGINTDHTNRKTHANHDWGYRHVRT